MKMKSILGFSYRTMVARGFSSDDGDRGADDTGAAVRVQRVRVGPRVLLPDGNGRRDFLLILPHDEGAPTL